MQTCSIGWMGGILFLKHGIYCYFHLFRTAAAKRNGWKIAALEHQLNHLPPAAVRPAPPIPSQSLSTIPGCGGKDLGYGGQRCRAEGTASLQMRHGGGEEYARGDRFCPCAALYFPFCPLHPASLLLLYVPSPPTHSLYVHLARSDA